jgi:hypothetical protein
MSRYEGEDVPALNYIMKAYGGVDAQIHVSLTSALVGAERWAWCPCSFTPGPIW